MFASQCTVTWRHLVVSGKDAGGNDKLTTTDEVVDGCAVWFEPGTESDADLADQVETVMRVVFPVGHAAPGARDRLVFLGDVYEVVAEPLRYFPDPSMTIAVGPDIRARRVTG